MVMHQEIDPPAAPLRRVLRPGLKLWTWDKPGANHPAGGYPDPYRLRDDAAEFGAVAVLVHGVGAEGTARALRYLDLVARPFGDGVQLVAAVGSRGPDHWREHFAEPAIAALKRGLPVMLDWESAWDHVNGREAARACVAAILEAVPDAKGRVTDCPWWAPLELPAGGGTHPSAPTREFDVLCDFDRYPQAYGGARTYWVRRNGTKVRVVETPKQVEGRSLRMIRWSRDASQYPALGTPASCIFPTFQGYTRTVHDIAEAALVEPDQCVWQHTEYAGEWYAAMRAVNALRARGYDGVDAIARFQRAAGLAVDGILGPVTLAALQRSAP